MLSVSAKMYGDEPFFLQITGLGQVKNYLLSAGCFGYLFIWLGHKKTPTLVS